MSRGRQVSTSPRRATRETPKKQGASAWGGGGLPANAVTVDGVGVVVDGVQAVVS